MIEYVHVLQQRSQQNPFAHHHQRSVTNDSTIQQLKSEYTTVCTILALPVVYEIS